MALLKAFSSILILLILPNLILSHTHDCYYDESKKHVEYDCDGDISAKHFSQKTENILYCHNYASDINRSEIQSISFYDCLISGFWNNRLYLDHFINLRVLNISSMDIDDFPYDQFHQNHKLERIIASHNKLTLFNSYTFDFTSELIEIDFSYNQITRLYPQMFDNTPKLKIVNFSNNDIAHLYEWTFSNLLDLETLNLNNNQIKKLDCKFLSTLTERHSLEILINTLEEVQTTCKDDEKHIKLDIVISPKESTTRLRISDGKFQWIFSESDFIDLQRLNLSSKHGSMDMLDTSNTSNTIIEVKNSFNFTIEFYVIDYVLVLIIMILAAFCVYQVISKNYKKKLLLFSVEETLLRDDKYQKINSQQQC